VKKYREADEVIKCTDMPDKLSSYNRLMKEIPMSDKNKYNDAKKVFEKNEFVVLKVKSKNRVGYILYNTKKKWEEGHTHLKSFDMAKTIINNIENNKKPRTNNMYILRSHMRVSNDVKYIEFIEQLINSKLNKGKKNYVNRG